MAPVCPDLLIEVYTFLRGELLGRELFSKPVLVLGRDAAVADIVLPSTAISRRHGELRFDGEQLEVRDENSTNGIRVNGARVQEAAVGRFDEIQVGEFTLKAKLLRAPTRPVLTATQTRALGAAVLDDLSEWDDVTGCREDPRVPESDHPVVEIEEDDDEEEAHEPAYSLVAQLLAERHEVRRDAAATVEVLTFGTDTVQSADLLPRGRSFWIGPDVGWLRRARFPDLQRRHRLLKVARGTCRVWLHDSLHGTLKRGSQRLPLSNTTHELRPGEAIDVVDGPRRYHVRFVSPPPRLREHRRLWQRIRPTSSEVRALGGSLGAHLGILVVLGLLLPPEQVRPAPTPDEGYTVVSIPPEPVVEVPPDPVVEAPPEPVVERPRVPRTRVTRRSAGPRKDHRLGSATGGAHGILDALNRQSTRHAPGSSVREAVSSLTFSRASGGYRVADLESAPASDLGVGGLGGGPGLGQIRTPVRNGGGLARRPRRAVGGRVTKVDFQTERPTGCRLDRAEIQRVVNLHIGQVQQCYERELLKKAGLSGKIRIEWVIRTDGSVARTRQVFSSMDSPAVSRCIMTAIRSWQFHASVCGEVTVAYPFIFESLSF